MEAARGEVRRRVWSLAGGNAPTAGISAESPLVIDVDATLVEAHSAKEGAAPTFKGGFGYHPLTAWFDHGADGAGECAAIMLRPGNAGANTAADHIEVISRALAQAGLGSRPGRKVLVRIDGAGGTKETVGFLARRRVSYSVGFKLPGHTPDIYSKIPKSAWAPAYNADGDPREGADVAEITDLLDLSGWPEGMRVIMRRERPHPGARLRFDDVDGYRLTAFATNTRTGQLADLEVRHRLRARCEDRIRCAKDTGLGSFPLQGLAANRIRCQVAALAHDLLAWSQLLALTGHPARKWEPTWVTFNYFWHRRPPRPQVGAQDDPRPADAHPRHHRPPRPPHPHPLQGRPPLDPPPAPGHRTPPDPARTLTPTPAPEDAP